MVTVVPPGAELAERTPDHELAHRDVFRHSRVIARVRGVQKDAEGLLREALVLAYGEEVAHPEQCGLHDPLAALLALVDRLVARDEELEEVAAIRFPQVACVGGASEVGMQTGKGKGKSPSLPAMI